MVPLSAPKLGARCLQQVTARSGAVAWLVTSCAGTGHQWGYSTGQLGWGYGSRWMEGGTAPGSSWITTGAITNRKVACAGVQTWEQGLSEAQGCWEQAGIPSHPIGVPLTWFGGALARCLSFPRGRAVAPALFCLEGTEQELGQAVLELKSPEPNEERLVLKGRCFLSVPRGGWKGCVEHSASFANSCYFV